MQVDGETQNVAEAQAMLWGFWESGPVGFGIYAFILGVGAEGVGHDDRSVRVASFTIPSRPGADPHGNRQGRQPCR